MYCDDRLKASSLCMPRGAAATTPTRTSATGKHQSTNNCKQQPSLAPLFNAIATTTTITLATTTTTTPTTSACLAAWLPGCLRVYRQANDCLLACMIPPFFAKRMRLQMRDTNGIRDKTGNRRRHPSTHFDPRRHPRIPAITPKNRHGLNNVVDDAGSGKRF